MVEYGLNVNSLHLLPTLKAFGQGAHKYFCLEDYALFLNYRDTAEFDDAPIQGDKLRVSTPGGKQQYGAESYLDLIKHLKPNVVTSLSYDVAFYSGQKRVKRCVDNTIKWLDLQLKNNTDIVFAVIQGSHNEFERDRCIKEVNERIDKVSGIVLGGFGLEESRVDRAKHINHTLDGIDNNLPRFIQGIELPEDILECVSQGIDLFNNDYPLRLGSHGYALTFAIDPLEGHTKENNIINLRDRKYQTDTTDRKSVV